MNVSVIDAIGPDCVALAVVSFDTVMSRNPVLHDPNRTG